jgi:hypothetical protein
MSYLNGLFNLRPFGSKVYGDARNTALTAEIENSTRIEKYRKNWRFYDGNQWDYNDPEAPLLTINYMRKFVDAHANHLTSKSFNISIPDDPETDDNESDRLFIKNKLDKVWKANKKDLLFLEMAQSGGVTGDIFSYVSWDMSDPTDPFIRIDSIPPSMVFPNFDGPSGPGKKKLNSVLIVFPQYTKPLANRDIGVIDRADLALSDSRNKAPTVSYRLEFWTRETLTIQYDASPPIVKPNVMGVIPLVHWPNVLRAGDSYGSSDIEDLVNTQRQLNETGTDISDTINYHGNPITVLIGALAGNLVKGANKIWSIAESDAKIQNLGLDGEVTSSMGFINWIKDALFELGDIPSGYFSGDQPSNTSGVALALKYAPMNARRTMKIKSYKEGLKEVNKLIMRMLLFTDFDFASKFMSLEGKSKWETEITFPDPLPRDESLELDKAKKRLDMGISNKQRELEKAGETKAEAARILARRREEQKQELSSTNSPRERSGNPNPVRPNPEVQGERLSLSSENDR